ncbi:MAG: hypothetical protein JJU05_18625 [Verrucomicrobia bacterium]|nr:hypothetical protein [Verrucomicrobiota bacterium]MCH8528250.1 hypothetical protein [Kiritimatiellia bacterium]
MKIRRITLLGISSVLIIPSARSEAPSGEAPPHVLERRAVTRGRPVEQNTPQAVLNVATLPVSAADYDTFQRERETLFTSATAEEWRVFFQRLRADARPHRMIPGQWHACVNDLFSRLTRQTPPGFNLEEALITTAREAGDTVIRDYALQHLAILGAGSEHGASRALLREASGWSESSLSGTALLNLYHLKDGLEDGTLAERALAVAANPAAHGASRSTALQIGVLLEDERFLDPAVDIARRTPVVAHRVSALRVISVFGGPEHRGLLLQLRRRGPEPVTNLANEALTRLDHES